MIPCIEDILNGLLDGSYTREQAEHWIAQHIELAAENADLRDHFAAKAFQAVIGSLHGPVVAEECKGDFLRYADTAYAMADAMLKARTA